MPSTPQKSPTRTLWAALCVGLVGCNAGVITGPSADAGVGGDAGLAQDAGFGDAGGPEDRPLRVSAPQPELTTEVHCVALASDERVLGVSPEGHLWLAASSSISTAVRVLDAWDPSYEGRFGLAVGGLQRVQAWTATSASFVAEGRLYHAIDGVRSEIAVTATLTADASLCGDPTDRAFVYSGGTLLQREQDSWLQWTGVEAALRPDARLLTRDGECFGADDGVWFASGDLELWQLGADEIRRPAQLDGATQPVLRGSQVLALMGQNLMVGPPPWTEYVFDDGAAGQLSAAGDYAWVRAQGTLLRFDGTEFVQVDTSTGAWADYPHAAGGIWTAQAGRVCHHAPQGMLRIDGLRSGAQHKEETFTVRVRAAGLGAAVAATLDGAALTPLATRDGWTLFRASVSVGWHALELSSDASDLHRTLAIKRIPSVERSFLADVKPIYDVHCVGCHVSGNAFNAPDLSSLQAWRDRAQKILERVVRSGDMPPPAARQPSWDDEEVTVINEWLSGGMRP